MMKRNALRLCNHALLGLMPLSLASGLWLEYLQGEPFGATSNTLWVSIHLLVSLLMTLCVGWHLQLNWGTMQRWYNRFKTHHSKAIRFITIVFLLTTLTGIIAIPLWLAQGHTGLGGVHGKIGYLLALVLFLHTKKHWRWFSR